MLRKKITANLDFHAQLKYYLRIRPKDFRQTKIIVYHQQTLGGGTSKGYTSKRWKLIPGEN